MRRLTVVSPIDGPSRAELVAAGIVDDIRHGVIAPGSLINLAEAAEHGQVKPGLLQLHLGAAERDGLLTLRGAMATVAPLDLAELRGIYRLLRTIETNLVTRASEVVSSERLDRLEAELTDGVITRSDDHDETARAVVDLFTELCRPAASKPELITYADTREALSRYVLLGFRAIETGRSGATSCTTEDEDRNALCRDIIVACRRRQAASASSAVLEFRRRAQHVAEMAFELYPARPTLRAL